MTKDGPSRVIAVRVHGDREWSPRAPERDAEDGAGLLFYLDNDSIGSHRGPFFTHADALKNKQPGEVLTYHAKADTVQGHDERFCVNCIGAQAERNREAAGR